MNEKFNVNWHTMTEEIKRLVDKVGASRLIIFLFFFLLLFLTNPQELPGTISNICNRIGMHGILVLAMIPSIRAGLGPNFSVPFAVLPGLLGGLIAVELNMNGGVGFLAAALCGITFALPFGLLYGSLMNRISKSEMMIATYFGYAFVALMCIGWLVLPFKNNAITWSMGTGLRNTINLNDYYGNALNNILRLSVAYKQGDVLTIPIGFIIIFAVIAFLALVAFFRKPDMNFEMLSPEEISEYNNYASRNRRLGVAIIVGAAVLLTLLYMFANSDILGKIRDALVFSYTFTANTEMSIPTGALLVFLLCCVLTYLFNNSHSGITMYIAGSNPNCAKAMGIDVRKSRMLGAVISTVTAAFGILVYSQGFGYLQLYNSPLNMCFAPVAAVLIGGASIKKASVKNAVMGVLLFQGILTMGPTVASRFLSGIAEGVDPTEIIRTIITNGIILYALAKAGGAINEE